MPPLTVIQLILLYANLLVLILIGALLYAAPLGRAGRWLARGLRAGLLAIVTRLALAFQRLECRLLQATPASDEAPFEELTPLDNADEDKAYDRQLSWALAQPTIRNIAVTGTYGSGKSSVIKTFQKHHREYRYLNISLAAFPESLSAEPLPGSPATAGVVDNNNQPNPAVLDGHLVEFSILQQILLHIRHNRLPASRFHRIRHQQRGRTFLTAFLFSLFVFTGISLFFPDFYTAFADGVSWKNEGYINSLLVYGFSLGVVLFVYYLLRLYANSQISKVKIPAAEVELSRTETSVLNRQIEEILYFFEVTRYEVVVIEDLDRFGHVEIFTKLREINQLINNAEQIKRKIVFIYVLGDQVFAQENRTKFFDFILPVIPVVNSSNAYQLLNDRLNRTGFPLTIPDQFIDEVSLYITDMRLLKNVMNEFHLYYAKLKAGKLSSLNDTYIFSLVLFKNLFPNHFAELQQGKGKVVQLFSRKSELAQMLTAQLLTRIAELEKLIWDDQQVLQTSIDELRMVYLTKWISINDVEAVYAEVNYVKHTINQLVADELFSTVSRRSGISIRLFNLSNTPSSIKVRFEDAARQIDPQTTYAQKEERIRARSSGLVEAWKKELAAHQELIRQKNSLSLRQLLQELSADSVPKELTNDRLLMFLLRNGYINEEYPYYISYFYPGSLLLTEHEFILGVKEQKAKPYNYPLSNLANVLNRLYPSDFRQQAILNFDLVNYLLSFDPTTSERLQLLLRQLANGQPSSTDFIDQYMQAGYPQIGKFVWFLAGYWTGWWSYLHQHPTAPQEVKESGYRLLLEHASVADLSAMDELGEVSARLRTLPDIPQATDQLIGCLSTLQVKVSAVENEEGLSDALVEELIEKSLYELSPSMIELLLRKKLGVAINDLPNFKSQPYSAVRASQLLVMNQYMDEQLPLFVDRVMLQTGEPVVEDEPVIRTLLSNESLSVTQKEALIRQLGTKLNSLQPYGTELWNTLVREKKVVASWENFCEYLTYPERDMEQWVDWANRSAADVAILESMQEGNKSFVETAPLLIHHPNTSKALFDVIVSRYPPPLEAIQWDQLDVYRISQLVDYSLVSFSVENFKAIRTQSRELGFAFLLRNKSTVLGSLANLDLDALDYLSLLQSSGLTTAEAQLLLTFISAHLYEHAPLATAVAWSILQHGNEVAFATLLSIVQYNPDTELNGKLAIRQLARAPESVDQVLAMMGGPYALLPQPNQRITFPATPIHKALISELKACGYFDRVRRKKDLYTVFTRKL